MQPDRPLRADDEARTRDLNLGKVALYQLSYVRLRHRVAPEVRENRSRCGQAAPKPATRVLT